MKKKTYKIRIGYAYLLDSGLVLIAVSRWNDGLVLFERSEGNTPFATGIVKNIECINRIFVGKKG